MKHLFDSTKEKQEFPYFHLSSYMLDQMEDLPIDGDPIKVMLFLDLTQTIQKLGWVEHTCDWDLNTIITLKDGSIIETHHGYGDSLHISLNGDSLHKFMDFPLSHELGFKQLCLTLPKQVEPDHPVTSFSIPISQIKSITLTR